MSGHSKWSTIKHQKGVADQRRGVAFTKLGRAITIAVRENGSGDPESNFSLRLAIDRAKAANMPKDNIERAIERGLGKGGNGENFKEVVYEAFGPQQIGIIIQVLTDNTNRTIAEVKKIIEHSGGVMASPGAVSYLFEKKGFLRVAVKGDAEEAMLDLIDLGAEDVELAGEEIRVITTPEKLSLLKDSIMTAGYEIQQMELSMAPKVQIPVEDEKKAEKVISLLEALDDHDDVQSVWTSFVKK